MPIHNAAKKLRIKDIIAAPYIKEEGMNPNYLMINDQKIFHVNFLGAVVDSDNETVSIDDGTGRISLRSFDENPPYSTVGVGDIVLVIGKPRDYNGKYILPEVVKKLSDPLWIKIREKELSEPNDVVEVTEQRSYVEESVISENVQKADEVVEMIKSLDSGMGVPVEQVLSRIQDGEKKLEQLKRDGEIFETKSGWVKVLE